MKINGKCFKIAFFMGKIIQQKVKEYWFYSWMNSRGLLIRNFKMFCSWKSRELHVHDMYDTTSSCNVQGTKYSGCFELLYVASYCMEKLRMKKFAKLSVKLLCHPMRHKAELDCWKLIAKNQSSWWYIIKQAIELWWSLACFENIWVSVLLYDVLNHGIEISPFNLEEDCSMWCINSELEGEISSLFIINKALTLHLTCNWFKLLF